MHPLGLSPAITDGDLILAESGAIVGGYSLVYEVTTKELIFPGFTEYLIRKYGGGKFDPPETGYIDNLYCKTFYIQLGCEINFI